ncbi:saccharopine dehydrogenase family protein [Paraburkholderia sp. GAS334]|uniref:saccharopine dehydrogenase family protein n=1 Tax=Paraburkholderia sp. GAS334 TaxID=3035131 RepID=UPI003D1C4810
MTAKHPIVLYGANGYTGQLVAEQLTRRNVPFVAAGRNRGKLEEALRKVPGNHNVQIEVVDHDEASLTRLLRGAKAVINMVGPYGQLGEPVVKAALETGVHYIDTTGEQDWGMFVRDQYGQAFADKGLLISPCCAYLGIFGMLAAEVALEDPEIDSLEILYDPRATPSYASSLSFMRMICLPNPYKQGGNMTTWPAVPNFEVAVPGTHVIHQGFPWGGGFEPIWLEHDERVLNCKMMVAVPKGPMVDFLIDRMSQYQELAKTRTPAEMEEVTNEWGKAIAPDSAGLPRENPKENRMLLSCYGRGVNSGVQVVMYSNCGYIGTGALCAEAARRIVDGKLKAVGFQSATRAFGHRELIAALAEDGLHCRIEKTF